MIAEPTSPRSRIPFFIGIDPDTHCTGIAVVRESRVLAVAAARIPLEFKGAEAIPRMARALTDTFRESLLGLPDSLFNEGDPWVVVEGQAIHYGRKVPPRDILRLALAAGVALGVLARFAITPEQILIPEPSTWKNNVPKAIHQGRIYKKLGWESKAQRDWAAPVAEKIPVEHRHLPASAWKHVGDAIGLALWAEEELRIKTSIAARMAK